MVLTRSQTSHMDSEERHRYLQEVGAGAGANPQPHSTGARRKDLDLGGTPQEPGTSDTFTIDNGVNNSINVNNSALSNPLLAETAQWRADLDSHLRKDSERERRRGASPAPRAGRAFDGSAEPRDALRGIAPVAHTPLLLRNVAFDESHKAPPPPSVHSVSSVTTEVRRKEAELRAFEELAEIRRKRLELDEELIQKRLAAEMARIEEEGSRAGSVADSTRRVNEWIRDSVKNTNVSETDRGNVASEQRRSRLPTPPPRAQSAILHRNRTPSPPPRRGATPHRPLPVQPAARAHTMTRTTSRERESRPSLSVVELAETMTGLNRIPPKQVYELPLFNGEADLDKRSYGANPLLIREVTERLTPHLRSRWCQYARDNEGRLENELDLMAEFLLNESDVEMEFSHARAPSKRAGAAAAAPAVTSSSRGASSKLAAGRGGAIPRAAPRASMQSTYAVEGAVTCLCCGGSHVTAECRRLRGMSVRSRWDWARQNRICYKCLNSRHRRDQCRARGCGEPACPHTHHRMLHEATAPRATTRPETPRSEGGHTNNAANHTDTGTEPTMYEPAQQALAMSSPRGIAINDVLLKIVPIVVAGPKGELKTHALLDEGSSLTLMDAGLAEAVGATGPAAPLALRGVGAMNNSGMSQTVSLSIRSVEQGSIPCSITAKTVRGLGLRPQKASARDLLKYGHMHGLEQACFENAVPYILLGADHWHLMVPQDLRTGAPNQPAAVKTPLGWVVYGILPRIVQLLEHRVHHTTFSDSDLNESLRRHYATEDAGIVAPKPRPLEERAVALFEQSVRRVSGPRFEVAQLWREDNPVLPPNYVTALKRLVNLENKFSKNREFEVKYREQIHNLIKKGYAEEVPIYEPSPKDFYLPHFAVINPNKPGKVRVVFDAAAQSQGKCLNDFVLEGPDMLVSLLGILLRFREGAFAVTADIEEMFLRILICEEDRASQMFLWRESPREPPRKFKMNALIFGAASSPFLAHSVRNRNADMNERDFPRAVTEIKQNHYMDDFVSSFASRRECIEVSNEVAASHERGGFLLRGWASNCGELLRQIPAEQRSKQPTAFGHQEKILGMLWDSESDSLAFNTRLLRVPADVTSGERGPTKREMLSALMSIFDPLGLINQYTITGKIQLQRLWALNIGWDEPLPPEERSYFYTWIQAMEAIEKMKIPRQLFHLGGEDRLTLHIFVDASAQAYAVTAYWRAEGDEGVRVSLAAAKAKVAPTKPLSIPRLELQAALTGARLHKTIMQEQRFSALEVTFWTDSRTVLHWVRDDARRYNPYVAHRLAEIAELTEPTQWRWVPTKLNPADDGTRADPHRRIAITDRWYKGPAFLLRPQEEWPQEPVKDAVEVEPTELRKTVQVLAIAHEQGVLPDINRFSNYERLIRATARIFQYIERLKTKVSTELQLRHIKMAEHAWLQQSQRESFKEDLNVINKKEVLSKSSRLYKLDPFIAEDGLLRMRGRINAAQTSSLELNPPILDGQNKFVKLLVLNEHQRALHANNERVVNDLRQKFWLLHLRPTVRAVASACQLCAVRRAMPQVPALGDLPPARLQHHQRAFTYSAVDYLGPYNVAIGRRREKRWVALFTCLSTRAMHLEIVATLSTDSAIMALRRLGAFRGYPRVMYSDNATCFRGADKELQAAYKEWLPALQDFGLTKRMEWRFIPPGAPNQGGAWERMVRSVKAALAVTLHTKAPKEEVLQTLLAEAEHCVNARPLTHVSVDARDPEALTPHHFLLGGSTGLPASGPCVEADRRTWRATQALADHFWARWVREYLPTLAPRQSTTTEQRQIQPGDVVIIVDGTLPRNVWPRGIVVATYPGPDGAVRSADVRTKGGSFRRPTRKLAVLPVETRGDATASPGGRTIKDASIDIPDGATIRASSVEFPPSVTERREDRADNRVARGPTVN